MFEKMKPIEGMSLLPMDARVAVGFGSAFVTKDNECVWQEESNMEWDSCLMISALEAVAANFPNSDWRVHLCGPLSEFHYQRQGEKQWVCYERGQGFA